MPRQRGTQPPVNPQFSTPVSTGTDDPARRAIFIRLLTCQILLGSFPAPHLLTHFNLDAQFGPLITAIRTGDRAMYYTCFETWGGWYRKRGLWLVLREKGEVLVWRSLFRNT